MLVAMRTLFQMGQKPSANDLIIIRRHYCTQLYLNNLCSQKCIAQCKANLTRAFDYAYGEFVLKPGGGALVFILREIAGNDIANAHEKSTETPKTSLGEEIPIQDPFTELVKHYEAATTQR